jgi:hypothetical protein
MELAVPAPLPRSGAAERQRWGGRGCTMTSGALGILVAHVFGYV